MDDSTISGLNREEGPTHAVPLADDPLALPMVSQALRQEVADGLLYLHHRANANTSKALEVAAFAYSMIELLIEKGLLTEEEINSRKREIAAQLTEKFRDNGMGVVWTKPEHDKYAFEKSVTIDCENRIPLCRASCCRLAFALTPQDVEERIVQWNFSRPYMILQEQDGYCTHMERGTCRCGIYEHRPFPCRAYDCRNDKRIWLDFEKNIVNPDIEKAVQHKTDMGSP
jgi:Fe-S-cluster containining protein